MQRFTASELGALMLIGFVVAHATGKFVKTRTVLAFLGVVLIGTTGFVGRILGDIGHWSQSIVGVASNWLFGGSLGIALFGVLVYLVAHALHPKHQAPAHAGFLALLLGAIVVAGVNGVPALSSLHASIVSAVASL